METRGSLAADERQARKRIVVTGATGFIGPQLCLSLKAAGHTVEILSRDEERARRTLPAVDGVTCWDPALGPPPAAALEGADAVVHLAAAGLVGRWTGRRKRAIRESRSVGTRNLVGGLAGLDARPGVLISMSAIGYYGDAGEVVLTEESPPGIDFLSGVVVDWEGEAARAEALGVRVVRLRTGIVLGRGGGALGRLLLPARLGLGGTIGSGRQWWSWVHMGDLAGVVLDTLANDLAGPVNVTAPEPLRQRDFARTLRRVLGRPALAPVPGFALRMAFGEVAGELLGSRRVAPVRLLGRGYAFRFPTLESALPDLLGR